MQSYSTARSLHSMYVHMYNEYQAEGRMRQARVLVRPREDMAPKRKGAACRIADKQQNRF